MPTNLNMRQDTIDRLIRATTWLLCIGISLYIWYCIGYYANKAYRSIYPDDFKPTYRTSVRLLKQ